MQPIRIVLSGLVLLSLCACGANVSPQPDSQLPDLQTLERLPSSSQTYDQNGIDAIAQSPGAFPSGNSLHLASTPGSSEWGVWRFTPLGRLPSSIQLNLSGTDEAWVGLSDFVHNRWQLSGPYSASLTLDPSTGVVGGGGTSADYLSPAGNLYLCVVVTGPHVCLVDSLSLFAVGNLKPQADFTETPPSGHPGDLVTLDASMSSDPDGTIVNYEWDLDNDDIYEQDTGSTSTTTTNLPNPAAPFAVGVRVTDNEGATATARRPLHTWLLLTVDNSSNVGRHSSLAVVNGRPAIAYNDVTNTALKYVQAVDADGQGWGTPLLLGTQAGYFNSMTIVDGNPAISTCASFAGGALMYVRAVDPDGTLWGPLLVAHGATSDTYSSLAVVNGLPAISYYDGTAGTASYIMAADVNGITWGLPTTVHAAGSGSTTLLIANGNPAVGFWDELGSYGFSRSSDQLGLSWAPEAQIFAANGSQSSSSFTLVDNYPAAALYDQNNGILEYCRANDENGNGWGTVKEIDAAGNVGKYPSLALINFHPAVSYYSTGANKSLHYVEAKDFDGSEWNDPQVVDNTSSQVGQYNSLAEVNAQPAISYYDATNLQLKYALLR